MIMPKEVEVHLKSLLNPSEQDRSPWIGSDRDHAELETIRAKPSGSRVINAYVAFGDACGIANSGQKAYAVNTLANANVNATIRVRWQGVYSGTSDNVVYIPAGGRAYIGCTGSSSDSTHYSFAVIGTVP